MKTIYSTLLLLSGGLLYAGDYAYCDKFSQEDRKELAHAMAQVIHAYSYRANFTHWPQARFDHYVDTWIDRMRAVFSGHGEPMPHQLGYDRGYTDGLFAKLGSLDVKAKQKEMNEKEMNDEKI